MNTTNRTTGGVVFEIILMFAAAVAALIGYVSRADRRMSEQKGPTETGGQRISPQELMTMTLPLDRRFVSVLEQIRRKHVPSAAAEADPNLAPSSPPSKLNP